MTNSIYLPLGLYFGQYVDNFKNVGMSSINVTAEFTV